MDLRPRSSFLDIGVSLSLKLRIKELKFKREGVESRLQARSRPPGFGLVSGAPRSACLFSHAYSPLTSIIFVSPFFELFLKFLP